MKIDLTEKQFRRLLDLVYIGNWVLNSTRGDDRIREYDEVESTVFSNCINHGMVPLVESYQGELIPSRAFAEGGIHEAILAYEDTMFFEILAQELALRDMDSDAPTPENYDELRERIRPFLMRRLKSEVLADLPRKREEYVYAAMTPEQTRVYDSLMLTLREHVGQALAEGSLPRARMQVLSILLKLRQVCCHPKLFLPDYEGSSGKLELLVQIVHNAIAAKRRMLIFSQFVGMLQMIRKRLGREGVQTLYLDGETRPDKRQELCDRFNGGEGRVFLISLKAGGTGLNLTGADLVIHYDPWWNPAAEDQATDRAHRIGQTHDVDVVKLIAQGTIEEKVTDLSKRKRAVFDRVVMAGETELRSLSEEDIRALFFS